MNTRSLILDAKNELIIPSTGNRLTFDNDIDGDEQRTISSYEQVQDAMANNYGMSPLLVRRSLGEVGSNAAYLLTPGIAKNPFRDFTWQRRSVENVNNRIESDSKSVDEVDIEIYYRLKALAAAGEIALGRQVGHKLNA